MYIFSYLYLYIFISRLLFDNVFLDYNYVYRLLTFASLQASDATTSPISLFLSLCLSPFLFFVPLALFFFSLTLYYY